MGKIKILSRTTLTKTNNGNTTLTQSTDGEGLFFTATILGFRNYKFGYVKYGTSGIHKFHQDVLNKIRNIEKAILKEKNN